MNRVEFTENLSRLLEKGKGLDALDFDEILNAIPRVDELQGLPPGTPVLLRLDLDVPMIGSAIVDDSRLVSSLETLRHCVERGWKTIVLGHIGRDGETSLEAVHQALMQLLGRDILFLKDWIDADGNSPRVLPQVAHAVQESLAGTIILLENTRKYEFERALWGKTPPLERDLSNLLFDLADDIRRNVCRVEVNEAIAASNHDFSSTVLPLVMDYNAAGFFLAHEFRTHVRAARRAEFIVFSGLKANKLDDLEAIIDRGNVRVVLSAGSIAMALRKGEAALNGQNFSLGRAETDTDLKSYISSARVSQGKRIVEKCRKQGVRVVLPIDFVLDSGEVTRDIPSGAVQLDVGPESRELFAEAARDYAAATARGEAEGVLYYNGVFGRFEDDRFAEGTRAFVHLLRELTENGVKTYVGGGEGRLALSKYGSLDDVTHAFTCGGTILKSLTNRHIGFLKAMYAGSDFQSREHGRGPPNEASSSPI